MNVGPKAHIDNASVQSKQQLQTHLDLVNTNCVKSNGVHYAFADARVRRLGLADTICLKTLHGNCLESSRQAPKPKATQKQKPASTNDTNDVEMA